MGIRASINPLFMEELLNMRDSLWQSSQNSTEMPKLKQSDFAKLSNQIDGSDETESGPRTWAAWSQLCLWANKCV